ncbi:Ig domain-containing protein [Leptospira sp. WS39.C2]
MFKKVRTLRIVNLSFIVSFLIFLVVCSNLGKPKHSLWIQSLFVIGNLPLSDTNKEKNDPPTTGIQSEYEIHSMKPNILIEDESFEIIGNNLMKSLDADILGSGTNKYITYLETSDTKLIGHINRCPSVPIEIITGNSEIGFQKQFFPCLGSFPYSLRSFILDLNQPLPNMSPVTSDTSLEFLSNLGEIQFEINRSLPVGMSFDQKTGIISGIPLQTTNNEFLSFIVYAKLKDSPEVKIKTFFTLIVLTNEEKSNRTCRSISPSSTCNGPSPHTCTNASKCFYSQMACIKDPKCGF